MVSQWCSSGVTVVLRPVRGECFTERFEFGRREEMGEVEEGEWRGEEGGGRWRG
jgi:hypothetical protein